MLQENLSRMMSEERNHSMELERVIASARAREAMQSRELTELNRVNIQLREALHKLGGESSSPQASPQPKQDVFTPTPSPDKVSSSSDSSCACKIEKEWL